MHNGVCIAVHRVSTWKVNIRNTNPPKDPHWRSLHCSAQSVDLGGEQSRGRNLRCSASHCTKCQLRQYPVNRGRNLKMHNGVWTSVHEVSAWGVNIPQRNASEDPQWGLHCRAQSATLGSNSENCTWGCTMESALQCTKGQLDTVERQMHLRMHKL